MSRWGWRSKPGQWHVDQVAYGSHIPEPLPDDQPARPEPPNRPRRYPPTPGTDRGRPSHITPLPEPEIPEVPEGLLIRLEPGEWTHMAGAHPGDQVTMRVSAVHPDLPRMSSSMVWVSGHGIECSWPSSTCGSPCFRLLVSVDALRRAVDR